MARGAFNLPKDKVVFLFGADSGTQDLRKGYDLLTHALAALAKELGGCHKVCLTTFGGAAPERGVMFGCETVHVGPLRDEISLALIYSAADAFVAPSREDNLPNTVLEAMACGTPSIAYNIGGMPDMITHLDTGWLAAPFASDSLAAGLHWIYKMSPDLRASIRERNRLRALAEFPLSRQAGRYQEIYQEVSARVLHGKAPLRS